MDIAVFGRIRDEPTRRNELARRRIGAHAAPGGPWEAKDVSQTGFKLVAPIQVANAVTLGTLVAIHPHGQPRWTLGIIRRMKRTAADRAEIGLQIIADTISAVDLVEQRKRGADEYSIDGEGTTINGRRFGALLLALRARDGEPMVQSLIVPAVEYQPVKRYRLIDVEDRLLDPLRPADRAAARLDLDGDRAAAIGHAQRTAGVGTGTAHPVRG